MKRLSRIVERISNWRNATLATIIMILYASLVMGGFSDCFAIDQSDLPSSLGLSMGYESKTVYAFFEQRSVAQNICYREFILIWDNLFSLIYCSMYLLWLGFLLRTSKWSVLNLFPLIPMILDWIENAIEISMVNQFLETSTIDPSIIAFGSTTSILKWSCSLINYGLILYGIIWIFYRRKEQAS